jgi:hypothetical protein
MPLTKLGMGGTRLGDGLISGSGVGVNKEQQALAHRSVNRSTQRRWKNHLCFWVEHHRRTPTGLMAELAKLLGQIGVAGLLHATHKALWN